MADKSKADYLDVNFAELNDDTLTALVAAQRETYAADKAAKAAMVARLNELLEMPEGRQVTGTTYTRWGQAQIIVNDTPKAKEAGGKARPTLAAFLAAQASGGHRT